ncbi:PEGA domain-containing protein [Candidatus Omnitrophota bacterium]
MKKSLLIAILLFLVVINSGCVRRIVTIDSKPPGAEVYLDRKLIGNTPLSHEFLYYGTHHLELVKPEHTNLRTEVKLKGPFYEYLPFSFITEVLIPWQLTDQHNLSFELEQGQSEEPIISIIEQPQPSLPGPDLQRVESR